MRLNLKRFTAQRIAATWAFAAGAIASCPAGAATVTFFTDLTAESVSTTTQDGSASSAIGLPEFNMPGQMLTGVAFSMTTGLEQNIHLFNSDFFSNHAHSATFAGTADLTQADISTLVYNEPNGNYNGSTGVRQSVDVPGNPQYYMSTEGTVMGSVPPANIGDFVGSVNIPGLDYAFMDASSYGGSHIEQHGFNANNEATSISVTYTYQSVATTPEPGAISLALAGGLGAVQLLRRRRR